MRRNQSKYHLSLRTAFVPLALLLGVMLTDTAVAADGKEYPGSMCKESFDNTSSSSVPSRATGDVVFDAQGNALNLSTTSARFVSCPLVRDAERHTGHITYAAVNVYRPNNPNNNHPMFCSLYSNPYFGGAGWVRSKTVNTAGLQLLEFTGSRADTFTSGSFNFYCMLPRTAAGQKSGIYHYGIIEAD